MDLKIAAVALVAAYLARLVAQFAKLLLSTVKPVIADANAGNHYAANPAGRLPGLVGLGGHFDSPLKNTQIMAAK